MCLRPVRLLALLLGVGGVLLTASCGHFHDLHMQFLDGDTELCANSGDDSACAGKPPSMMSLGHNLDCLERQIEQNGSVVIKVPDVWGQARLTKYREEFEEQMALELPKFQDSLQGRLAREDQAFFAQANSLSAAISGDAAVAKIPGSSSSSSQTVILPPDLSNTTTGVGNTPAVKPTTPAAVSNVDLNTLNAFNAARGSAGAVFAQSSGSGGATSNNVPQISLEPTEHLLQKEHYLNLLNQIRRTNEGDDTADSPGYSLNLVRIPVSLLPGKKTDTGYGAEVTMTMAPVLGDDLLPTTFRNLVMNDLVDQIGFPLVAFLNDEDSVKKYLNETTHDSIEQYNKSIPGKQMDPGPPLESRNDGRFILHEDGAGYHPHLKMLAELRNNSPLTTRVPPTITSAKQRNARLAFPPSQIFDLYGYDLAFHLAFDANRTLKNDPANLRFVHLPDLQAYLKEELFAAYKFLTAEQNRDLWSTYCTPEMAQLVHGRQVDQLRQQRELFREQVYSRIAAIYPQQQYQGEEKPQIVFGPYQIKHSTTAALAWAILVESAMLNDQLVQDMKETSSLKGCSLCANWQPYYLPAPPPEARQAFKEYVRCRWPIHVFALDPKNEEQNIADSFTRRRETQLALSLAFVTGNISASSFTRYARRLESEYDTVALNRTAIGFSHGEETFGWRFYPRFQTPDIESNLVVLIRDLLIGGPSRKAELRKRKLEPGIRECVAIVVMPSFVPYLTCDVTSNWFDLTNPKHKHMDSSDAMRLSRSVKQILTCATEVTDACQYRDGDLMRLRRKAEQLEARLPLQTMPVQVPYENTLGGFQMFNSGVTDLAPELLGWYGASGIARKSPTSLFLVGNHFNVKQTNVIAGGTLVVPGTQKLLSRQVISVTIPGNVQTFRDAHGNELVDVHLATPYGVTAHLLIPVVDAPATGSGLVWSPVNSFDAQLSFDAMTKKGTIARSANAPASLSITDTNERATALADVTVNISITGSLPGDQSVPYGKVSITGKFDGQRTLLVPVDALLASLSTQMQSDLSPDHPIRRLVLTGVVTTATGQTFTIDDTLFISLKPPPPTPK